MDPHNNKKISSSTISSTSGCWDLDMTTMGMGNQQLLLDHLHMEFFHPMEPTRSSQPILAPSNLISVGGQVGIHGEQHRGGGGGGGGGGGEEEEEEEEEERLGAMKEMMYKIAAMQPVDIDPATIRKPKRRNVRISDDPQSVAARHRRERISERIRILQRLVPGGTKMDTASMLDEAIRYVKFLKRQVQELQSQRQRQQPPLPLQPPLAGTQLAATGDHWQLRADALGSSSSSIGATPGLGFIFSGDGSFSRCIEGYEVNGCGH